MKSVRHLVESFAPVTYDLSLDLDKHKMKFAGEVTIVGNVPEAAASITLHGKNLDVLEATIDGKTAKHEQDAKTDELTFTANKLAKGEHTIWVKFKGDITKPMVGVYPCFYKHKGKEEKILATQFESHHAREVFPCVDEPAAKAVFNLTLATDPGEVVLSNTEPKSHKTVDGRLVTVFKPTPNMSSYLLAFVVGDLKSLEKKTKDGVLVRTWATRDNVAFTEFALDVGVQCLDYYGDFFKTKFPLKKCDMVALPDFAAGAMENWGLITYREAALLVDPKNTSIDAKQWVAMVVAHELAHQWFGNLVTMAWWTDLWLNEGFASWVEFLAIDHIFPEWKMWTQFVSDEMLRAQSLDGLANTHPVEVPVKDPDSIRDIFDAISYAKGASMIRMLDAYVGRAAFREGLAHYLKTHAYGNAATNDLWKALEEHAHKPVAKVMSSWTKQPGFPLVKASETKDGLRLHQQRFYFNPSADLDHQTWPIPLTSNRDNEPRLMEGAADTWKTDTTLPFKLNTNQTGFYMSTYDENQMSALATAVASKELNELDRLGLLNDQLNLAIAGAISTRVVLELLKSYEHEDSPVVWDVISSVLLLPRRVVDSDELREAMKPLLRKMTAEQVNRLGWDKKDSDTYFDELLRPTVLSLASLGEDELVVAEAKKRFKAAQRPEDIAPDLRGVIYGTVARDGSVADFDKLHKWHKTTNSSQEKSTLAGALTSFKQPELIKKSLALLMSDEVKPQDVVGWIAGSFANHKAKDEAWKWLRGNWDWIQEQFGTDIMTFSYFPKIAARAFATKEYMEEYDEFFAKHAVNGIERSVKQGHEIIEYQTLWRERDAADILAFFDGNQ